MQFGQKIQLIFILVMLTAAGYFFFHNTEKAFDMSVNSWVLYRHHGVDGSKPIGPANAEDLKKLELVNGFGFVDGTLDIVEYPNATDPPHSPTLKMQPESRGAPHTSFMYYQNPLAPVDKIKDPLEHALALGTYHLEYDRSISLFSKVGLTADQLAKEKEARTNMNAAIAVLQGQVDTGTFHTELMDKVMKVLNGYKAMNGDPQANSEKSAAAHNVIRAAADYIDRFLEEKDKTIATYNGIVEKMLTDDQKTKLIAAAEDWEKNQQQRAPTRRGRNGGAAAQRGGGGGGASIAAMWRAG